jgi:uridine phosphorylase
VFFDFVHEVKDFTLASNMTNLSPSELIINPDGSIYHLHLCPGDIADTVFFVGDPERVEKVSRLFDKIELKRQHREFVTHTGYIGNKRLTVISTGIGTDNIDIVLTELDALVNIDFATRQIKPQLQSLQIIRLGTTGSLRADIPVDSLLASGYAIGLDGFMSFYNFDGNTALLKELETHVPEIFNLCVPYATNATLDFKLDNSFKRGITLTCPGFYGPQNRRIRLYSTMYGLFEKMESLNYNGLHISNMEMETAGIYAMAEILGHKAISLNAILANRVTNEFSKNPEKVVDGMIEKVLDTI